MLTDSESKTTNLTTLVFKGATWMMGLRLVTRGTGILVTLILARLLTPDDFGLVAISVLAVSLLKVFTECGFRQSLVKEAGEITTSMLNTAWSIEVLRGTAIMLIVFLSSSWVADFFNSPESVPVIKALGVSPFLQGLTNIRIIHLQKELEFNKQFFYEASALLGQVFIAVPLAFILQNVWAIVLGTLASVLFKLITSYILMPYTPRFEIKYSDFRRLFIFGKWIFLGSIVSYFAMELDNYVAAKIFDVKLLGIYVLAFSITNKPIIEITKGLGLVLFPAYAKIGDDKGRVKNAFLKSTPLIYSIIVPICVGISLIADDFVKIALSDNWVEIIPVMAILAIASLARGLTVPANGFFLGIGKPQIVFIINSARMIVLAIFLFFIVKFTLPTVENVAYAVLYSNVVAFILFVVFSISLTFITLKDWLSILTPLMTAATFMAIGICGLHLLQPTGLGRFFLTIISGVGIYIIILFVYWGCFNEGPVGNVINIVNRYRGKFS